MRYFIIIAFSALVLASCSPNAKKQADKISGLENDLKENGKKGIVDTAKVSELLNAYKDYIKANPEDSASAVYLIKSGKFYATTMQVDKAIICYHEVYSKYPKFSKADYALFSEAFLYENEKHDLNRAQQLYQQYLKDYPTGQMAKSADFELKNLGKPIEQVMDEITKNKAGDTMDVNTSKQALPKAQVDVKTR